MKILKSKQVMKYIEAQDKKTRGRINDAFSKLPLGDIVPVAGHENTYRLRIGNLRAIFLKEEDAIKITVLDTRGQVYKK